MRGAAAIIPLALACAAIVWACGEFTTPAEAPDAGAPDAGAPDGSSDDSSVADGGGPTDLDGSGDAGVPFPVCPRPPGPRCAIGACPKRPIYTPPSLELPFGITTDSAFVYWTALVNDPVTNANAYNGVGKGRILRTARAPGSKAFELAKDQYDAVSVTIAGAWIYWGAQTTAADGIAELRRTRRDCTGTCVVEKVAVFDLQRIRYVGAIDATRLFVVQDGSVLTLVEVDAAGIGTKRVSTSLGAGDPYLVQTLTHGFVTSINSSRIDMIDIATHGTSTLVTLADAGTNDAGQSIAPGMGPSATDCSNIYGSRRFGSLWRLPFDGGQPTLLTTLSGGIQGMTTDAVYGYAARPNVGGVTAVNLATGAHLDLWNGNAFFVAVDDGGVYWGDHDASGGGTLWMMEK